MTGLRLIYVTVPSRDVGKKLAHHLLDKKLIACANIFAPHTAIYHWEDKIREDDEYVVILKTPRRHIDSAMDVLVKRHPYDTPCIIVLEPENAHQEFVQWVERQTTNDKK